MIIEIQCDCTGRPRTTTTEGEYFFSAKESLLGCFQARERKQTNRMFPMFTRNLFQSKKFNPCKFSPSALQLSSRHSSPFSCCPDKVQGCVVHVKQALLDRKRKKMMKKKKIHPKCASSVRRSLGTRTKKFQFDLETVMKMAKKGAG